MELPAGAQAPKKEQAAPTRTERYGVLVTYADGEEEWMRVGRTPGSGPIAKHSKAKAEELADFMRLGMAGDPDIQSIDVAVVPAGER